MKKLLLTLFALCAMFHASAQFILSEIMVDPDEATVCPSDGCEFVEVKNQSNITQDIGGWKVTDNEAGTNEWAVTFPANTTVAAWDFVIVTKNAMTFASAYPGASCAVFEISNSSNNGAGLGNGGDDVSLVNPGGSIVQSYTWFANSVDRAEYNGASWAVTSGGTDGDPCVSAVLPIFLTGFRAAASAKDIVLHFSTEIERDNAFFDIERSANGLDFEVLGRVKGAGNSSAPQQYAFTDIHPLQGKNYYRLRQEDFDGRSAYSHVVAVNFGKNALLTLSPVPATDMLQLQLDKPASTDGLWQIFDLNGRLLLSGELEAETTQTSAQIGSLPEACYTLRLVLGQSVETRQFYKKY